MARRASTSSGASKTALALEGEQPEDSRALQVPEQHEGAVLDLLIRCRATLCGGRPGC